MLQPLAPWHASCFNYRLAIMTVGPNRVCNIRGYSAARTKLATGRPKRMRMRALAMMSRCRRMGASLTALRDLRTHAQAGQLGTRRARGGRRLCGRGGEVGTGLSPGVSWNLAKYLSRRAPGRPTPRCPARRVANNSANPIVQRRNISGCGRLGALRARHTQTARVELTMPPSRGSCTNGTRCSTVQYPRFTQTHEFRAMYRLKLMCAAVCIDSSS